MLIYKLTFKCGKSYIGQTVRKLKTRLAQHRQSARLGSPLAVHNAWRIYGEPTAEVLCECASQAELHESERMLIEQHGTMSPNGYNVSKGGDTAPSQSPEVAAKIAAKATGRKHSEETKAITKQISARNWQNPEYRKKVSAALKAAFADPEVKAKHATSVKEAWAKKVQSGWVMSDAHRAKLKGRVFSEETRKRMSESAKKRGMPERTAETRKKISDHVSKRYASMTPEQRAELNNKIRAGHLRRKELQISINQPQQSQPKDTQ